MHPRRELPDHHPARDCATRCGRICGKCVTRLSMQLRTLLGLYRESDHSLIPAPARMRERVSGSSRSTGIVLDEQTLGARSELRGVLSSWARLVAEGSGAPGPYDSEVGALVQFLRAQLDWLAGHPAAVDFDDEVRRLLEDLGGLFGPGPVKRFALGECPEPGCGGLLHGVMRGGGGPTPGHVSCDAGHALPPHQWLSVAGRMREHAA